MTTPTFTRRVALLMVALAPLKAHAAEPLSLPMRFACMRMDPDGFAYISSQEQGLWRSFQSRLGGLISDIRPIQPANRLGLVAPKTDSGASCALAARALALEAGFDLVLLYGTLNGRRSYEAQGNVLSRLFASLRSEHGPYDPSTGEAHLLDAGGGAPLLSFRSDAPPKSLIDRVPGGREPELEALTILIDQFEQRLLDVARDAYRSERSIAD